MGKESGIAIIPIILIGFVVLILGTAGAATLALTGEAPACPTAIGQTARTANEIGNTLQQQGAVTITNAEATTLAKSFLGRQVSDPRVCFTEGLGHVSGKINLEQISLSPSFYVSGGVDLSGSTPKITNLQIQLGALPNIPFITAIAENSINKAITENIEQIELKERYSADFSEGLVTVRKQ